MSTDVIYPGERKRFSPNEPAKPEEFEAQGPLVVPATWEMYETLDAVFQDTGSRVRFLDHYLEIMPPISRRHESRKIHISCLLEAWCLDRDIELFGWGSTTLKIP